MVGVAAISKSNLNLPKPKTDPPVSSFIYLLTSMAVIGGFLFGYDTGIVSSAMLYVVNNQKMRPISHFWQELIVAITPAFAAFGSLFAGMCGDRFGRKKLITVSSIIFAFGAVICAAAVGKMSLLFGRILLGLAIGVASMIVPVYVGECAPTHVRGKLLSGFNMMVCFGQMASNVVAAGFSYIDEDEIGWRLMFGFAALPAIVQFVGFLFLPESPRWLYNNVNEFSSREVLKKVYAEDEAWVDYEIQEIAVSHQNSTINSDQSVFWNVISTRHLRKALLIGCSLQFFQQLAGINTLMYYTGSLVKSVGVADNHTTIWVSCIISGVNFIGNFIPYFVIERIGRRKALLTSSLAVALTLSALGTAFLMVNRDTMGTISYDEMEQIIGVKEPLTGDEALARHCLALSNCDYCVTDDRCGFCSTSDSKYGLCLPLDPLHPDQQSSTGFCSPSFNSTVPTVSFSWTDVNCKTKYTLVPLVLMVVYLMFFNFGFSPIPWILNAEFYPLWARGTCVSIATFCNWSTNLVISLTFLSLTNLLTRFGTFYLYSAITFVAFFVFKSYVPETKNCSLDEVEQLFMNEEDRLLMRNNMKNTFENSRKAKYTAETDAGSFSSYPA